MWCCCWCTQRPMFVEWDAICAYFSAHRVAVSTSELIPHGHDTALYCTYQPNSTIVVIRIRIVVVVTIVSANLPSPQRVSVQEMLATRNYNPVRRRRPGCGNGYPCTLQKGSGEGAMKLKWRMHSERNFFRALARKCLIFRLKWWFSGQWRCTFGK